MNGFESINEELGVVLGGQLRVSEMLDSPLLGVEGLQELLEQARRAQRLAELVTVKLLRELQYAQAFHPHARASFNAQLHKGRFARSELKHAVRLADELFAKPGSIDSIEGAPARMPHTAQALAAAQFGMHSAVEISATLDQIPSGTPDETIAHIEDMLAGMATVLAPDDLRKAGQKILQGLNADAEPRDSERQRRRSIAVSAQSSDLMAYVKGKITPELKSLFDRLFADYAGPGDLLPAGERRADIRTAAQRRHDALVAALKTALHREGPMPPTRGCSTVVATMTLEQLQQAAGAVQTDVGTLLPIPDLIRLGADRNAFLAILDDDTGNLIELGRTKRAADVYAYLGLVAAQGCDMAPGSDLPAAMCEIHHRIAWRHGGETTGANLLLVGHRVHRNIDDTQTNPNKFWTVGSSTGQMLWRQPESLDPDRRLQANFNPATWFNPGQTLRFGMFTPQKDPPFHYPLCMECRKQAA